MDARLPLNPNLGFYRKNAKELKRSLAGRDQGAADRFIKSHPKFQGRSSAEVLAGDISLGDAQLVIARELGFSTWTEFKVAVSKAVEVPAPSASDRLLLAVRADDVEAARALCASEAGLAATPDSQGTLPLVEACDRGTLDMVTLLLDAGADPRRGDPLLAAAHAGPHKRGPALDVVALLIERGAPNDVFTHASLGRIDDLRRDLQRVDVNARGPMNSTALFLAAWNGQVEAVRVLLEAGAEPNPICRDGQSAWQNVFLHIWSEPHREIARILLDHGVPCSFHEACTLSHLPTVKRLLAAEPELKDQPNARGTPPIVAAVLNADVELARALLNAGAADPEGQGRALVDAEPQHGRDFAGAVYRWCNFQTSNFHNCNLRNATFSDIDMSGVRIDNVNLAGARIDNASITGLTIYGIEVAPILAKELERRAARKDGKK